MHDVHGICRAKGEICIEHLLLVHKKTHVGAQVTLLIEDSESQSGVLAVEVGQRILQGDKPEETTILIPAELITRDNVDQYKGWTAE